MQLCTYLIARDGTADRLEAALQAIGVHSRVLPLPPPPVDAVPSTAPLSPVVRVLSGPLPAPTPAAAARPVLVQPQPAPEAKGKQNVCSYERGSTKYINHFLLVCPITAPSFSAHDYILTQLAVRVGRDRSSSSSTRAHTQTQTEGETASTSFAFMKTWINDTRAIHLSDVVHRAEQKKGLYALNNSSNLGLFSSSEAPAGGAEEEEVEASLIIPKLEAELTSSAAASASEGTTTQTKTTARVWSVPHALAVAASGQAANINAAAAAAAAATAAAKAAANAAAAFTADDGDVTPSHSTAQDAQDDSNTPRQGRRQARTTAAAAAAAAWNAAVPPLSLSSRSRRPRTSARSPHTRSKSKRRGAIPSSLIPPAMKRREAQHAKGKQIKEMCEELGIEHRLAAFTLDPVALGLVASAAVDAANAAVNAGNVGALGGPSPGSRHAGAGGSGKKGLLKRLPPPAASLGLGLGLILPQLGGTARGRHPTAASSPSSSTVDSPTSTSNNNNNQGSNDNTSSNANQNPLLWIQHPTQLKGTRIGALLAKASTDPEARKLAAQIIRASYILKGASASTSTSADPSSQEGKGEEKDGEDKIVLQDLSTTMLNPTVAAASAAAAAAAKAAAACLRPSPYPHTTAEQEEDEETQYALLEEISAQLEMLEDSLLEERKVLPCDELRDAVALVEKLVRGEVWRDAQRRVWLEDVEREEAERQLQQKQKEQRTSIEADDSQLEHVWHHQTARSISDLLSGFWWRRARL